MFNSIIIQFHPQQHTIGKLAECLLFYDEVNLLLHSKSLSFLLENIGIDELDELRNFGLNIFITTDYFGAVEMGQGSNISLLGLKNGDMHYRMIETAMKEFYNADKIFGRIRRRVVHYKDITQSYQPNPQALEELYNVILHSNFHKKVLYKELEKIGLENLYLNNKIEYSFITDSNNSYILKTNLNIEKLNRFIKAQGLESEFNFSQNSFLLTMVRAFSEMMIAAEKKSDLLTLASSSLIISNKIDDIIQKTNNNLNGLTDFQKIVLPQYKSIEEVINSREKNFRDLMKLLESAHKFKEWKKNIPSEKKFIEEYSKAISSKNQWIDKLPSKIARFLICESFGFTMDLLGANGIGTLSALGLSAFDSFIFDSLVQKWQPNQFVSTNLKNFVK